MCLSVWIVSLFLSHFFCCEFSKNAKKTQQIKNSMQKKAANECVFVGVRVQAMMHHSHLMWIYVRKQEKNERNASVYTVHCLKTKTIRVCACVCVSTYFDSTWMNWSCVLARCCCCYCCLSAYCGYCYCFCGDGSGRHFIVHFHAIHKSSVRLVCRFFHYKISFAFGRLNKFRLGVWVSVRLAFLVAAVAMLSPCWTNQQKIKNCVCEQEI